jgi:hypothetical protein
MAHIPHKRDAESFIEWMLRALRAYGPLVKQQPIPKIMKRKTRLTAQAKSA